MPALNTLRNATKPLTVPLTGTGEEIHLTYYEYRMTPDLFDQMAEVARTTQHQVDAAEERNRRARAQLKRARTHDERVKAREAVAAAVDDLRKAEYGQIKIIVEVVASWDLTTNALDAGGRPVIDETTGQPIQIPLPIDEQGCRLAGFKLLNFIQNKIMEDMSPNDESESDFESF